MPDKIAVTTMMDDGSAEVTFTTPEPKVDLPTPDEAVNLVPFLLKGDKKYASYMNSNNELDAEGMLKEMGQIVCEEYKIDKESRSDWEQNMGKAVKLFTTHMNKKNFPWENASNVCLPFLSISALQFHARAYDAIIPAKEVAKVLNTDPHNQEEVARADRVARYMNYQLLYKMEEFEEDMDKALLQLPIVGSMFKKSYYDPILKRNKSEYISAFDFVINYRYKNLESAQRKTHILRMTVDDIRRRVQEGIFRNNAWDLMPGSELSDISSEIKDRADEAEGRSEPGMEYNKPRILLEQHRSWDLDGDGICEPYVITVDLETEMVVRVTSRKAQNSHGKDIVLEYFTEYVFFPNPEGAYGLGFGMLIRGLNESANTILNEIIDAGSLANMQGGFYLRRSGMKAKDFVFQRGKYKAVDAYVDDIRKAIFNFDFKGPNQALFSVLGLLFEYSQLVSSVSETMTGQMPASDTPATTVLALIEEGRKVFSGIHKRCHRSFKKELKKLYQFNSIYLDEQEYFQVLGDNNMPQGQMVGIGRADFVDTFDIIPVSDPIITSRAEKVTKAQAIVQDVRTNPLTAQNMQANFEATKRYYESLEAPNVELLIQSPEPQDVSPHEENAGFLMEKPATVLPHQDHQAHMQIHETFMQTEFVQRLSPAGQQMLQHHNQEHLAQLYLQTEEQNLQMQALQEQQALEQGLGGMMGEIMPAGGGNGGIGEF